MSAHVCVFCCSGLGNVCLVIKNYFLRLKVSLVSEGLSGRMAYMSTHTHTRYVLCCFVDVFPST